MNMNDNLQYIYTNLHDIELEKEELKNRLLTEENFNFEEFTNLMDVLTLKYNYLNERLSLLISINLTLKSFKENPKLKADIKDLPNSKNWEIFENNLKNYQWLPFEGEICDFCGRTQSSTTAIAVALLPSKSLSIICSRCYENVLKNQTTQTQDKLDAAS